MFNSFNRYDDTVKSVNRNLDSENAGLTGRGSKNRLKNFFYILPLIFLLLALLFSGIMLHYHNKHSAEIDQARDALGHLSKNLKYSPIENLKVVAKTANCPTGYNQENFGKFKGVNHGCLCHDGGVHSKAYCLTQAETKCKYTSGVKPHDLTVFKGEKLCSKRYAKWMSSHKEKTCDATFKKCQTTICVPSTGECPISSFNIVDGAATSTQNPYGAKSHYTADRATTSNPIVNFEATVSNAPCAANTLKNNQIHSKKVYPLDTVKNEGCGKYGDIAGFAHKSGEEKFADFNKENGLEALNTQPFHNQFYTADDKAALYAVDRAPIKDTKECHDIAPKKVQSLVGTIEDQNHTIYVISIIIIVLASLGLLVCLLFLLMRHKIKFLNSPKGLFLIIGIALIVAILGIILFSIYQHAEDSNDVEGAKGHFANLDKHKCLEKTPGFHKATKDVTSYADTVKNNVGYLIIALFVASLVFIVLLAVAIGLRKAQKMSPVPDPAV